MTTVHCAICGDHVPMDQDNVRVEAEHIHTVDRNEQDDYVLHTTCWNQLTDGWVNPA